MGAGIGGKMTTEFYLDESPVVSRRQDMEEDYAQVIKSGKGDNLCPFTPSSSSETEAVAKINF